MKINANRILGTEVVSQHAPADTHGGASLGHSMQLDSSAMGGLQGLGNGSMSSAPRRGLVVLGKVASTAGNVMGAVGGVVPLPPQARALSAGLQTAGAGLTALGQGATGKEALVASATAGVQALGSLLPGPAGKTGVGNVPAGSLLRKP